MMVKERKFVPDIDMEADGNSIHIGAYVGDAEVGFLDASLLDDQILITSIYVMDEYRREQIATDILNELVDFLYVEDLHIPLSMDYILDDELKDLHEFIKAREDFLVISQGMEYVIPKDLWNDCFGTKQIEAIASAGIRIDELLSYQKAKTVEVLKKEDLYMVPEGKTLADIYDNELSQVVFSDDEFKAGILAKKVTDYKGEELIEISVGICETGCEPWMMKLLAGFLANMRKNYPDHSIRLLGINDKSINLISKFFENKAITKPGYSAIWLGI